MLSFCRSDQKKRTKDERREGSCCGIRLNFTKHNLGIVLIKKKEPFETNHLKWAAPSTPAKKKTDPTE